MSDCHDMVKLTVIIYKTHDSCFNCKVFVCLVSAEQVNMLKVHHAVLWEKVPYLLFFMPK